jgi:L-iditol 2-dehydrogenase
VGNPASDVIMDKAVYWKVLRRQLTLKGIWNSSYTHSRDDDWHYCLKRLSEGQIHPEHFITHRLALSGLERGLLIMRDKTEAYGKVMTVG